MPDSDAPTPAEFAALPVGDQIKALDGMAKDMPYGVRPDRLEAYAGSLKWPIKDDASSPENKLALADVQDELQADLRDATTFRRRIELEWSSSRKVLTLALEGFNWDAAVQSGISPDIMTYLAGEVWSFLVEVGGADGRRRSQMLQCMGMLRHSLSTTALPKSGEPSSGPATASGR